MNLTIYVAFIAGLASFLSPCIFPVIPSYLTYISGASAKDLREVRKVKVKVFRESLLFVLGFTVIFTLMGIFFSGLGAAFSGAAKLVNRISGIVVILLGANFILDFWSILNLEKKFRFSQKPSGSFGSVLLGMAFGAGWTPCIGPILASILLLAGSSGSVGRGALLLISFSIGLGLPFIITGLFFSRLDGFMKKMKKNLHTIKVVSGLFLISVGVLIFSGQLSRFNITLFQFAGRLQYAREDNPETVGIILGIIFFTGALLGIRPIYRWFKEKNSTFEVKPEVDGITNNESREKKLPAALILIVLFLFVMGLLSVTNVIQVDQWLVSWLLYQGI